MIDSQTLQLVAKVTELQAKIESLANRVQRLEREKTSQGLVINNLRAKVIRYGKALVLLHDQVIPMLENVPEKKLPTLEEACFLHAVCTR